MGIGDDCPAKIGLIMETKENNKAHQMIIYVNELEEFETSITKKERRPVSVLDLIHKTNSSVDKSILREDIFIGQNAKFSMIKERIEEWQHLAFLRPVNLEINYACEFHPNTAKYSNKHSEYLHFFDECIMKSQLLNFLDNGNQQFDFHLNLVNAEALGLKNYNARKANQNEKAYSVKGVSLPYLAKMG